MKIPFHIIWLAIAVAVFFAGFAGRSEEVALSALIPAGISLATYIASLKKQIAMKGGSVATDRRFEEIENRLGLAEAELDQANLQIERLRMERDFDRQLQPGLDLSGVQRAVSRPES